MVDPRVQALCDEFNVRIIAKNDYPRPGETRSVATLAKIIDRHGIGHARAVMITITETANNKASLDADVFGAVSDLLLACAKWYEDDPSKWLQVFDACPVGELQYLAHDLRGFVPARAALAGLLFERLWRAYGPRSVQADLLDERAKNR